MSLRTPHCSTNFSPNGASPLPSQGPQDIEFAQQPDDPSEYPSPSPSTSQIGPLTLSTALKLASCTLSFFSAGLHDGTLGPLIPYILSSYRLRTSHISIIYISSFLGWLLSSLLNPTLTTLPVGIPLLLGSALQLLAHCLRFWDPPFWLLALGFWVCSLGVAFQDPHSNTFVAGVRSAHRWLGLVHACYALGGLVGPFVATGVATKLQGRWGWAYLVLVGVSIVNFGGVLFAFRDEMAMGGFRRGSAGQESSHRGEQGGDGRRRMIIKDMTETLRLPSVWLLSLFFFLFLGVGLTAGGWLVEYLVSVRHEPLASAGYVPSGFGGGIFLGRLLLAEPTHRFGERRMVLIYCVIMLAMQLIFWLVPNFIASATAISLLGFAFGPLFATGVSVGSKLFPRRVQATGLGFVFVLAQAGGSLFPALTGIIASRAGVQAMQPILVGLIVAVSVSWMLVPKIPRRDD